MSGWILNVHDAVTAAGSAGITAIVISLLARLIGARLDQAELGRQTAVNEALSSEAKFLSYMNNGPFSAFMRDQAGRYQFVNPVCAKFFGMPAEEALGKSNADLFSAAYAHETALEDSKVLNEGVAVDRVIKIAQVGGAERYWHTINFPVMDSKSKSMSVGGIAIDVTQQILAEEEQERAQQQLIHSYKLTALGNLAGNIAHEINNPLAILDGRARQLCELLQDDPLDVAQIRRYGESISETSLRLVKIVNGLKTFTRKSDQDAISRQPLKALIDEVAAVCMPNLKERGVLLHLPTVSDTLEVDCRQAELSQVLLNLLMNACDAAEKHAERWIKIDVVEDGGWVDLAVTDSGGGVSPEVRDKIMGPFFTTKPLGKGTGLGLSISRQLLTSHGGTLTLDETAPHTRFVMRLPKRQRHLAEAS